MENFLSFFYIFAVHVVTAMLTKICWSYSVAEVFHLPDITFWQALFGNCLITNLFAGVFVRSELLSPPSSE